jgi:site-specific recombinase XerD
MSCSNHGHENMKNELTLKDLNVIVPNHHREKADKYFSQIFNRLPPNTQRSYKSDLKSYYQFCFLNDMPGLTQDVEQTEISIKAYVTAMCQSQLTHNTIVHRMSTLSKFMSIANLTNPLLKSEYLRDFIKLEMRDHDIYNRANQAPALRVSDLEYINENLKIDTLLDIRDLAMVNMMFDGLLRADELASVQIKHIDHMAHKLFVPTSKSDQSGAGQNRYISDTTLNYVSDYINESNIVSKTGKEKNKDDKTRINKGILFRSFHSKGTCIEQYNESATRIKDMVTLNYTSIYRALKRVANKAGIDIAVTGHSQRVGAAVSMAEAGVSTKEIQDAGGWKGPLMVAKYTEQANIESGMSKIAKKFNR